jgi:hypothetical protein
MKQPLTEREQQALGWARSNYRRNWRKRFSESLAEHMAAMPQWMRLPDFYPFRSRQKKIALWRNWYFFPFGDKWMNVNVAIMRRLLRERRV